MTFDTDNVFRQRVSSSIDSRTGELRLHLKKNYQYDTTGMRYNLPKPGKGDRYHGELLLREDQLLYGVWRQKSRQATKALKSSFGEDITADVRRPMRAHIDLQLVRCVGKLSIFSWPPLTHCCRNRWA